MLKTNTYAWYWDILLSSRIEIECAREWLLDCIADNMDQEEAQEIADSWSDVRVARWVDRNYPNGLEGWKMRGETEYR